MRLSNPLLKFIEFSGGLDQVTPPLKTKEGTCSSCENFEVGINGGYESVAGYEAFDGSTSPSDAKYSILGLDITDTISEGDTVEGLTSLVSAVVLGVGGDYVAIPHGAGSFALGETVRVSGVDVGAVSYLPIGSGGASSIKLDAQYKGRASDIMRQEVSAVPGVGSILGAWRLNGVTFAVRGNELGEAKIYKSSISGWLAVEFGREITFSSGGPIRPQEGDLMQGGTASASVLRVVLESGSWDAGTASGRLIVDSQAGTFASESINIGANIDVFTVAGDSVEVSPASGGSYETVKRNFGGEAGQSKIYGCDGVNRGFEFDGSVYTPINTGMSVDSPSHVSVHKNHLFFSFDGSAQHSATSAPYIWSPVFGAAEIAVGDTITGFMQEPGTGGDSALIIYSRNSSNVLYGSSSEDWSLVKYRDEVGAYEKSIQQLGITLFMDDRGITNLNTTQSYGNFQHSSFSNPIQPLIISKKNSIAASSICREKNQYRLFFSDGSGIYVTMEGGKMKGIMPIRLAHIPSCMFSVEDSNGDEIIMFGAVDGKVYQMEKGTSFDGENITFFLRLHFLSLGSPRVKKAYKGCALEVSGEGYSEANFSYDLDYSSIKTAQSDRPQLSEYALSNARWDEFTWDNFYWDSISLSISEFDLSGSGENISLTILGEGSYFSPLKISGAILRYIPRRQLR